MHKKLFIWLAVLVIVGGGLAYFVYQKDSAPEASNPQTDEKAVRELVIAFGSEFKNVSLAAPKEIVIKAIEENYASFVSPEILNVWKTDPIKAPGRLTSSPWPDRIEIIEMQRREDGSYEVQGKVIEVTSIEVVNGGIANQYGVGMIVRKIDDRWVITGFTKALRRGD